MYDIDDGKTHGGDPAKSITKREHFAAMAMQALLSDHEQVKEISNSAFPISQLAVMAADALIEALNKC